MISKDKMGEDAHPGREEAGEIGLKQFIYFLIEIANEMLQVKVTAVLQ